MATLLDITVQSPQNEIQRYGTGALIRVERGTSRAMPDASEITTVAIVAGKNGYEYRAPTGSASASRPTLTATAPRPR